MRELLLEPQDQVICVLLKSTTYDYIVYVLYVRHASPTDVRFFTCRFNSLGEARVMAQGFAAAYGVEFKEYDINLLEKI